MPPAESSMTDSNVIVDNSNNFAASESIPSVGFREARARQIFTMEFEFVQCLSNPDYLQCKRQKCLLRLHGACNW